MLYNNKIERIRVLEYEKHSAPLPIKFDISDGYSGVPTQKIIKIQSESAPKVFNFDCDLASESNPRVFESQLEQFNRLCKFRNDKELFLTDYTKDKDGNGVDKFIEALHSRHFDN